MKVTKQVDAYKVDNEQKRTNEVDIMDISTLSIDTNDVVDDYNF